MEGFKKTKAQWYWKSNVDPWDKTEEPKWTPYEEEDNIKIEKAFLNDEPSVQIGKYKIVFKDKIQYHVYDSYKRRPIMRQKHKQAINDLNVQDISILYNEKLAQKHVVKLLMPPIVRKWLENEKNDLSFVIDKNGKYKDTIDKVKKLIDKMIVGLVAHSAESLGNLTKVGDDILDVMNTKTEELFAHVLRIYIENNSIAEIVDQALRKNDLSVADEIGPLCFMINYLVLSCSLEYSNCFYNGVIYKKLSINEVNLYKMMMSNGCNVVNFNELTIASAKNETENSVESFAIIRLASDIAGAKLGSILENKPSDQVIVHAFARFLIEKIEDSNSRTLVYLVKV
jgi:hypothetical protein